MSDADAEKDKADRGSRLGHSSDTWTGYREVTSRVLRLDGEAFLSPHPLGPPDPLIVLHLLT